MKKLIKIIIAMPVLLTFLLTGCSLDAPSDPTGKVNPVGPADAAAKYVAIGNSLTAGYMDSGLMKAGQANSFPMLVASQMGLDKTTFTQPWIEAPGIGSTEVGDGLVSGVLRYTGNTVVPLAVTSEDEVQALLLAMAQPTPYHNLGVPGAFSTELMNTYSGDTSVGAAFGKPNKFFDFINRPILFGNISVPADDPTPAFETASQFGQAIAKGAALSTIFIGGNDFLHGAVTGEPIDSPLITDPAVFAGNYGAFVGTYAGGLLKRNGFKPDIIVTTLPLVENIPYFLAMADFVQVFGAWDMAEADAQYVLITDFLSWFMDNLGGEMPQEMTLDTAETGFLNGTIGGYNQAVQGTIISPLVAPLANFGLVDVNDALGALEDEKTQHFLYLRAKYGQGETPEDAAATAARTYFSLDGVHPNNKGYAFLANEYLTAINELTGSSYAQIPLAAITWDPTYGVPVDTSGDEAKSGPSSWPTLSKEVAQGMKDLWR